MEMEELKIREILENLINEDKIRLSQYILNRLEATESQFKNMFVELSNRVVKRVEDGESGYQASLDIMMHDADMRMKQSISDLDDQIKAILTANRELVLIKPVADLWKDKQKRHDKLSAASFIAFAILCSVAVYYFSKYVSPLASVYALNAGNAFAANSIVNSVVILAPLLGAAWVLKLISRVFIINLSGSEDAQLRRAIAETYVNLVGEPNSEITKEERALALSALFRPAGSAAESDVTPPTFVDLLKGSKD